MIPGVKSQQTFREELQQTKNTEEEQSQIIHKKGSYFSSDMQSFKTEL